MQKSSLELNNFTDFKKELDKRMGKIEADGKNVKQEAGKLATLGNEIQSSIENLA